VIFIARKIGRRGAGNNELGVVFSLGLQLSPASRWQASTRREQRAMLKVGLRMRGLLRIDDAMAGSCEPHHILCTEKLW
jgi:hypothetical protein